MAITTYSEVQDTIADYLARSDLTSYIPDFIVGAETRIAYGSAAPFECPALRCRAMETSADITFSSRTASLPTGYLEMRRIYWSANPNRRLEQMSPEQFYGSWIGTENGLATHYVIEGDSITIGPAESGTAKMLYYKKFTDLATDDAEWLLANSPHVYVYGALLEAAPFLHNDERIQTWFAMYRSAIEGLNKSSVRDRWSGSALAVRSDTGHP